MSMSDNATVLLCVSSSQAAPTSIVTGLYDGWIRGGVAITSPLILLLRTSAAANVRVIFIYLFIYLY